MSIEETIDTFEKNKDEIDKRKPKPFRYIDNESDNENKLTMDKVTSFSVMKTEIGNIPSNFENQVILSNNENIGKIVDIIKKHEEIRKLEKK